jgi:hypothetical protein
MKVAGMIAGISAIVFAIPHFWYWFGISLTFPGDFPSTLPHSTVLLVVGGFAILAAIYVLMLVNLSFVRRLPEWLAALPAWFGAVGFTLWGLAFFVLQAQIALGWISSTSQYVTQNANPNAVWGYYWYSLFLLWGLSLGTTAFYYHKLKRSQPRAIGNE